MKLMQEFLRDKEAKDKIKVIISNKNMVIYSKFF
jgi:hypothetical protein